MPLSIAPEGLRSLPCHTLARDVLRRVVTGFALVGRGTGARAAAASLPSRAPVQPTAAKPVAATEAFTRLEAVVAGPAAAVLAAHVVQLHRRPRCALGPVPMARMAYASGLFALSTLAGELRLRRAPPPPDLPV